MYLKQKNTWVDVTHSIRQSWQNPRFFEKKTPYPEGFFQIKLDFIRILILRKTYDQFYKD